LRPSPAPRPTTNFFGYVNLRVVLELLRRAGRNLSAATLAPAIERVGRVDLGGYTVTYGPNNHHGSKFVDITIIGPGGRYIR
jgi:ABC-type branched-subunit amino acid transport system substrate-binding protein